MAQLHLARLRKDGGHEHREAGLHELRRLQIEVAERQPPSRTVQLQPTMSVSASKAMPSTVPAVPMR